MKSMMNLTLVLSNSILKVSEPEFEAEPTTEIVVSRLEGDSVRK
jgi:hypothetical protein